MPMVHAFARGPALAPVLTQADGLGKSFDGSLGDKVAPWFTLWRVDEQIWRPPLEGHAELQLRARQAAGKTATEVTAKVAGTEAGAKVTATVIERLNKPPPAH